MVSFEDYQRLQKAEDERKRQQWEAWAAAAQELGDTIRAKHGRDLPLDEILEQDRRDLESRV